MVKLVGFHRSEAFILREDDEVIVVLPTFVHKILTHFQDSVCYQLPMAASRLLVHIILPITARSLCDRNSENRQISHYTENHPRKRYQRLEYLPRGAENNAKQCPNEDAWKAE
ncbi:MULTISPECIES: hypothetical protein [unclassified Pseudomonas]|uniref:hypothetical protein n=1 Tax=unclassified Pseudomonas TaxID=196821 RepID=UPI0030D98AB4